MYHSPSPHLQHKRRLSLTNLQLYILNLSNSDLEFSPSDSDELPVLKPKSVSQSAYFKEREPLIVEEMFAELRQALRSSEAKATERVVLDNSDVFYYYKDSEVTMAVLPSWGKDHRIQCHEVAAFRFIVAIIEFPGQKPQIAILNKNFENTEILVRGDCRHFFETLSHVDVRPLNSLISLDRMYQLFSTRTTSPLIDKVIAAEVSPWSAKTDATAIPDFDEKLNSTQAHVVKDFQVAESGIFLLQGPPGTGKTTTITALLKELMDTDKATLVCAPSNKAVQVLARRVCEANPFAPICLVGVESKIPPELKEISIAGWLDDYPGKAAAFLEGFIDLSLDPTAFGKEYSLLKKDLSLNEVRLHLILRQCEKDAAYLKKTLQVLLRFYPISLAQKSEMFETFTAMWTDYIGSLKVLMPKVSLPRLGEVIADVGLGVVSGDALVSAVTAISKKRGEIKQFFRSVCEYYDDYSSDEDLLQESAVIFATLSSAGRPRLKMTRLNMKKLTPEFDVLVIDEAGQAVESEALLAFSLAYSARKALIVGDTRQLPATTIADSSRTTHFDWSLMWRLIEENSAPFARLDVQYRMRSAIRHFPSERYYDGSLSDHPVVATREPYFGVAEGHHVWVDVTEGREERSGSSYLNRVEASELVKAVRHARLQAPHASIGVISFYSAQVDLLRRLVKHESLSGPNLVVNTVDGFQGDECDMIFISFVRAGTRGEIGFLSDFRRLNVAITRARHGLYVFGHGPTFKLAKKSEPNELLLFCSSKGSVIASRDFLSIFSPKKKPILGSTVVVRPLGSGSAALASTAAAKRHEQERRKIDAASRPIMLGREALLKMAIQYEEKLNYEKAIEIYQKILEQQPGQPALYEKIADCYERMDQPEDARMNRDIAKSLPLIDAEKRAERAERSRPVVWESPPDYIRDIESDIVKKIKDVRQLSNEKRFREAEKLYRELLAQIPENPEVLIGLGWSLNKQKRQTEALPYFLKSQKLRPSVLAFLGLAHISEWQRKPEQALDYVEEGLDLFPWSQALKFIRDRLVGYGVLPARARDSHKTADKAFPSLSSAVQSKISTMPLSSRFAPGSGDGLASSAVIAMPAKLPGVSASTAIHKGQSTLPDRPKSFAAVALAADKHQRLPLPLSQSIKPVFSAAVSGAGDILDFPPAVTVMSVAAPVLPAAMMSNHTEQSTIPARPMSFVAVALAAKNKPVPPLPLPVSQPVKLRPVTDEEIENAIHLSEAGDVNQALLTFEAFLKRDPENPRVLSGLGWSYTLKNFHEKAIPHFEKSLSIDVVGPSYLGLARCYSFLGDKKQALEVVQSGLKKFPGYKKLIDFKTKYLDSECRKSAASRTSSVFHASHSAKDPKTDSKFDR